MSTFLDEIFLLRSEIAYSLYENYAKDLPIVDYHCHIDPKEIAENKTFKNLTEIWLSGDHYKWRLMRANNIDEDLITGNGDPKAKFIAWADTVGKAIGSPLYHWNCLELKKYFGISEPLNSKNAEEIWNKTCSMMEQDPYKYSARGLIERSGVEIICTTDDPCDDLRWHKMIRDDESFKTQVLPSFRPDPILDIEKDSFEDYIKKLESVSGTTINTLNNLLLVIDQRIEYFHEMGSRIADHGMERFVFERALESEIESIFEKRKTSALTRSEIDKYKTYILLHCARKYAQLGFTMQLHFGCIRDINKKNLKAMGVNCGCDSISGAIDFVTPLSMFLSELTSEDMLPRTILYSLDPNNNTMIDTLCGCFLNVYHGAEWWFNDNMNGMLDHMKSLSCQGYLPSFIGMLTDSRSFLSYTRHEYFRRILCSFISEQIDQHLFPYDEDILKKIIEDICYNNSKKLFE